MNARSTAGGIAPRSTGWGSFSKSSRASLADPRLEPSGQKIVGHSQLPDLCMQRPHSVLIDRRGFPTTTLKDVGRAVRQRLLPLMNHRGMHAIFRSQFRHGPLTLQGLKRNTGFEPRIMVPAFLHRPISSFLETCKAQIIASVTVRFSGE